MQGVGDRPRGMEADLGRSKSMPECDPAKGCPVVKEMYHDLYKDNGIRDRAIKSVCRVDMQKEKTNFAKAIIGRPLFYKVIGGIIIYCVLFSAWSTRMIYSGDTKYVQNTTLEKTLKDIDKRLGDIQATLNENNVEAATEKNKLHNEIERSKKADGDFERKLDQIHTDVEGLKR